MSLVPALIAVFGVLVGIVVGYIQWRRTRELELEKLAWEREKLQLTQQLERERAAEDLEAEHARQLRAAEETERATRRATRRSSASDSELAEQYRHALVAELRNVKILDMSRPLDLEKIYVQMTICEEPQHFVREREIRQLAEGDDRYQGMRPARNAVVTIQPDEGLRRHRRIVVLGDPGSGKTTMLRHLAMRAGLAQLGGPATLPVYIELRHFVDSGMTDVVSYAATRLGDDYGFDSAGPYIEGRFIAGEAVLLLDGLDEVRGGASAQKAAGTYDRIISEINRVAIRYPSLPIAVTCRRAGWIPSLPSFVSLEVVDFTWDQICAFIANWFDTQPDKARQLRQTLSSNLRMQTLATNPLILSLIAIVFERDLELPERRAELYKRCAEVMLREWDAHRGIRRFSKFTTDRKRDLLQEVAWHFHRTGKRYFPKQELVELIAGYLPSIGIAAEESEAILDEIAAQYGLIKEQAHDWYGFLHLTMQEYFAAVAVASRPSKRVDFVVRRRHDPWWEEVLLLLAGQLPDATDMLLGILGISIKNRTYDSARDDVFASDLMLAARCLVGSPRVEMTSLRSEILNKVEAFLLNAPSAFHRERAAAVLAEVGTEESAAKIYGIVADELVAEEVRAAAAHALSRLSDANAGREIDRILAEGPVRYGASVIRSVLRGIAHSGSSVDPQRLIDLLKISDSTSLRGVIYSAMGNSGDAIFIPALIDALRSIEKETGNDGAFEVASEIVSAVVKLKAYDALPIIYSLAELKSEEYIFSAIAQLGGPKDVEKLLEFLSSTYDSSVRMGAGRALRYFKRDFLAGPAVKKLADPQLEWGVKWLIVAALDAAGVECSEVEQLYENVSMQREVRVAIATLMASRARTDLLPDLRTAIRDEVVPPSLVLADEDPRRRVWYTGMCWDWICTTLRSQQDYSVITDILRMIEQKLRDDNPRAKSHRFSSEGGAEGMIYAAAGFESDALAYALLKNLDKIKRLYGDQALRWTVRAMTKSTAAEFAKKVFEQVNSDSRSTWFLRGITKFLAEIAEDQQTVTILYGSAKNPVFSKDVAEIYQAIRDICQKGRFRLFSDGSIRSISEFT